MFRVKLIVAVVGGVMVFLGKVDFDKILILEDGRKPASSLKWMGLTLGGAALALGSVAWLFAGRQSAQA